MEELITDCYAKNALEYFKNIKSKIDKNLFKSAYIDLRLKII